MLWLLAIACHADNVSWDVGAPETWHDFAVVAPVMSSDGTTGTLYVYVGDLSLAYPRETSLDALTFGRGRRNVVALFDDALVYDGEPPDAPHIEGHGVADLEMDYHGEDTGFLYEQDGPPTCPSFTLTWDHLVFPRGLHRSLVVEPFTLAGDIGAPGFDCEEPETE